MREGYFNFLVEQLTNWFHDGTFNNGSRFYLLLKHQSTVAQLYQQLTKTNKVTIAPFDFYAGQNVYHTIALTKGGQKAIIVPFDQEANPGFLVHLQSELSTQQGPFTNAILIYLTAKPFPAIIYNARNLSDNGGPLNIKQVLKNLETLRGLSQLKIGEKALVTDILRRTPHKQAKEPLAELAEIYNLLQKKTLLAKDYQQHGYFYDAELRTASHMIANKRIQQNHKLHLEIQHILSKQDPNHQLENYLSFEDPTEFAHFAANWQERPFNEVYTARQNFLNQTFSTVQLQVAKLEKLNRHLNFWVQQRHFSDEQAQLHSAQEYSILAFVKPSEQNNSLVIRLPFNAELNANGLVFEKSFLFKGKEPLAGAIKVVDRLLVLNLDKADTRQVYYGQIYYKAEAVKLPLIFKIAVLPMDPRHLTTIAPTFSLSVAAHGDYAIQIHSDTPSVTFLNGNSQASTKISVSQHKLHEFFISQTTQLDFAPLLEQTAQVHFTVMLPNIFEHLIPLKFQLHYEPIVKHFLNNYQIENLRRQSKHGLFFDQNKLIDNDKAYYLNASQQHWYALEQQMTQQQKFYGKLDANGNFQAQELDLPDDIQLTLEQLAQTLMDHDRLLSLSNWPRYFQVTVQQFLDQVSAHLSTHNNDNGLPQQIINLFYIGAVWSDHSFYLSPFSPLLLAYQLYYNKHLTTSTLNETIQAQLSAAGLMPYLILNNQIYQADRTFSNHWLRYTSQQKHHLKSNYAPILSHILTNYKENHEFLLQVLQQQPLKIRFIHIRPDATILNSIVRFFINDFKKSPLGEVTPLELHFEKSADNQIIEAFLQIHTRSELAKLLGYQIDYAQFSDETWQKLIQIMQNNLAIYFNDDMPLDEAFHITFFQPQRVLHEVHQLNTNLEPSYALNGLIPNAQTTKVRGVPIQGFGTKNADSSASLIDFAAKWNSLAMMNRNYLSPYILNDIWAMYTHDPNEAETEALLSSSNQTLIFEPGAPLIDALETDATFNLTRYHVADPVNFDVVAVTKNTNQQHQWQQYLAAYQIEPTKKQQRDLLAYTNLFNDYWHTYNHQNILQTGLKQITAYKEISGLLYHPDFIWVPISISVFKRYAKDFGLTARGMPFTAKNLTHFGLTNSDLLLMGLNLSDSKVVQFYILPILIGRHPFAKANLAAALNQLDTSFLTDYIKIFLGKLFYTSLKQLPRQDVDQTKKQRLEPLKDRLFNAHFELIADLDGLEAHALRFTANATTHFRTVEHHDALLEVKVPNNDIYTYGLEDRRQIEKLIQGAAFDFKYSDLLSQRYQQQQSPSVIQQSSQDQKIIANETMGNVSHLNQVHPVTPETNIEHRLLTAKNLNQAATQFYLGRSMTNQMMVNWAYSNPELTDRHLLMFGDNSSVKMAFIRQLLKQFTQVKISMVALITDEAHMAYFDDADFDKITFNDLDQMAIRLDPFAVIRQTLTDHPSTNTLLALINQVVSLLRSAFKLTSNETEQLIQAISNGLTKQPDTFRFTDLPDYLSDQKLLAKLAELISHDPFTYQSEFHWREFFNGDGHLFVIKCQHYPPKLRTFIIDYMLNNLLTESVTYGNAYHPLPIFMDDTSILNLDQSVPIARALEQGSQYGLSLILNNPHYEPTTDSILMTHDFETELFFKMSEEKELLFAKIKAKTLKEYSNLTQLLTKLTDHTYLIAGRLWINHQLLPDLITAQLDMH
ncbi:hypothetical protein FHQ08_05290 [Lactobacillus sp. CC-MHH1034]|uniref:hypothetical protein n=1 Tax=Agrilactobacillus fermenti TaxID=2586909 RepID=UPI001E51ADC5|nr:hypothetical protein [Agrilactobacillus fermenti]MCD2256130.1 hypothetical protein [Agrilactobacillus fermenti]